MMTVSNYRDLVVWQKSMDLAFRVYESIKLLPKEEFYGLSDQIRRAVVSIPSNIAEGHQRGSSKEYMHFLYIAKESLGELETQLLLCEGLNYIRKDQAKPLFDLCNEIGKMLTVLIRSLR